jgi:Protein of unknown function (DUF3987)
METDMWPDRKPLLKGRAEATTPLPTADPGMYQGILGEIAEAIDPGTEADKVGVYGSLMSMAGAIIGRDPHIMIGDTRHPLLIWPLLIGRTNSGRKGDATNSAKRVVKHACPDITDFSAVGISSGEGIIFRIRDLDEKGNGTEDKRLFILEPEWARVMEACRREGSTLSSVLRQAWDGHELGSLTKAAYMASSSHVAILGHITPAEFRARINKADMAGGLYNRFLPLFVERRKYIPLPEGLDDDTLNDLSEGFKKAVARARALNLIVLDRQATVVWEDEIYGDLTDIEAGDGPVSQFVQRAPPYCLRIAALLSALDGRKRIKAADLSAAMAMVQYSIKSARHALDAGERNTELDRLRRAVDESPAGLSGTEVSALFGRNRTGEELRALSDLLCLDPAYELEVVPTAGASKRLLRRIPPTPTNVRKNEKRLPGPIS